MLKNGTIIDAINNHKGREYSTLTIGAPVVINEVRGNVAAVIKQDSGKNVYKAHRILLPDGSSFVYKKMKAVLKGRKLIRKTYQPERQQSLPSIIVYSKTAKNTIVILTKNIRTKMLKIQQERFRPKRRHVC